MTIPGQSQEEAADNADTFINDNVDAAKYNYAHHGLNSSLYDFGRAFHTVTSPAHEGYQVWNWTDARSHANRESTISNFRMGLAVGATLSLYRYTYGQAELERATGHTPALKMIRVLGPLELSILDQAGAQVLERPKPSTITG